MCALTSAVRLASIICWISVGYCSNPLIMITGSLDPLPSLLTTGNHTRDTTRGG